MGCKTIGRFVTDVTTATTVAAGGNIPFNTSTVTNNCISCDGSVITINTAGIYEINANFTFAVTAAGNVETKLYRNGNIIPGAHAINTVETAGNGASQSINAIITVPKNSPYVTLNFEAVNATSVVVANCIITKVA